MAELLKRNNLKPEEISAAAYYYNNPRLHGKVSKIMKFAGGVAQNSVFFQLGDLGTPMPFILLIGSLRRPKPEARIIMAGFGDGADAILMQVQDRDALRQLGKTRMGLTAHQKSMITLKNYNKFLEYKEFLEKDRYTRKSSPVTIWRDSASVYKWYGVKCKNCGVIQYPDMLRSCYICRADDQLERVKLGLKGTIFTYTLDHLVGGTYLDIPVPRCVIDLDGGGRVLLNMTEIEKPEENVQIGMRVELTFRKEHEGAEFKNYYWKCRPERGRP